MRFFLVGVGVVCLFASCKTIEPRQKSSVASVKSGLQPCEQEIARICPTGMFDGCFEDGLTKGHICVADSDRNGGESCGQENYRVCGPGFINACSIGASDQQICVQDEAAAYPDTGPVRGLEPCEQQNSLVCPRGTFDGCSKVGLTKGHICVANSDRNGGESCGQENQRVCGPGFINACEMNASDQQICVQKKENVATHPDTGPVRGLEPCEQQNSLVCPRGTFDGCDIRGLTKGHICVANSDKNGGESCGQENYRVCGRGFINACDMRASDKQICVQKP
jgi:hypothetical protein